MDTIKKEKVVILGAGLTGLSAAHFLKNSPLILEKEPTPGGLCRTVRKESFHFDFTGHLLHFKNLKWKKFIEESLHIPLEKHRRIAKIFLFDRFIPYPFQYHLAWLPEEEKEKCLNDFLSSSVPSGKTTSFAEWAESAFGRRMFEIFFKPYNEKIFLFSSHKFTNRWMGRFVPPPDKKEIIRGASKKDLSQDFGYNSIFYYPAEGGIGKIPEVLSRGKRILHAEVKRIDLKQKIIFTNRGKIFYDRIISTIPLPVLLKALGGKFLQFSKKLKWVSVKNTNIILRKNCRNYGHWIYFPEKKFPFYRIGFLSNFSHIPAGFSNIYIEESYRGKSVSNLEEVKKFLGVKEVVEKMVLDIPFAYVIYDFEREKILKKVFSLLKKEKILSTGRFGGWKYSTMEEALEDGFKAASGNFAGSF